MGLKVIADSVDEIPAPFRDKATVDEQTGSATLDLSSMDGVTVANVAALRGVADKERNRASELEKALKAFEGLDPEEARAAMERISSIGDDDPAKDLDAKLKQQAEVLAAKHRKAIEEREAQIKALSGELNQAAMSSVLSSLTSIDGIDVEGDAIKAEMRSRIKVVDEGGKRVAKVIDDSGEIVKNDYGLDMSPTEYVKEVLYRNPQKAWCFKGSGNTGSGATGNESGGRTVHGARVISADDQDAIANNLEKIASGEIIVR